VKHRKPTLSVGVILLAAVVLVAGSVACGLTPETVRTTFTADRTSLVASECTTLRWHAPEEQNVVLNGQSVNPSGQMEVCPKVTTTYQLSVGSGDDATQQEITIVVEQEATSTPPVDTLASPTATRAPATATPEPPPPPAWAPTPQPPPPPPPPLSFTFSPGSGPAGSDVELYLSAAEQVEVYYEGRVLPKRVSADGRTLTVTIPGNASSGYFELRWDGQSVRASQQFVVTPPTATLTLYNNSGQTVWYVFISRSDQATWGDDRLGSDVVPSGSSYVFSVPPGVYDLKAEDSNHNQIDLRWSVNVSGSYSWSIAPAAATLTLYNNSGQTVWYVYISPSDQATWGDDRLGSDVVASGSSYVFSVPPGVYDLKAEDSNHNQIDVRWSVNLSGSYSWSIAP
jgi:hypothetical protein